MSETCETEYVMSIPAWNDPELKAGTMIRGALWLLQEIGEGNSFTKEQIRDAFPGVSQADRRIRDLRDYEWVILTSSEDAALLAEDQRFVRAGVPVWDSAARRAAAPRAISNKDRLLAMERDDFMCTVCGISGGEPYIDDSNQTAVLSVTRRETVMPGGRRAVLLVTECKRCRAGSTSVISDATKVLTDLQSLESGDQRRLLRWMERGQRGSTPLERVWNAYRRLPATARDEVRRTLGH